MLKKANHEKLEKEIVSKSDQIRVSDINIEWDVKQGTCNFESLPVAMMWVDTTLSGVMSGVQSMVGTERFGLALQSEGRKSVEEDWQIISQYPNFHDGFKAIANIAAVAGWGDWELISLDENKKKCQFRVKNSWEGRYQKSLGVCWNSGMLAGKMAGYCSKLFKTNCWAKQTAFIAKGDDFDEFEVEPSERLIEDEIENLLLTDEATRADMAVVLQKLQREANERKHAEKELRESEKRYRAFFENGPDGVVILDPETARFIEFNDQACRQLGYSRKEFALLRVPDIEVKESAEETQVHIQKVLREGYDDFDTLQRTKQGEIRHIHITAQIIEIAGRPVYHCIWRDVTDRKLAEEAVRESESKFRKLFDSSPQAIALTDIESGKLIDVNNKFCELTKYSKEEILGLNTTEIGFYSKADRSKFLKELQSSGEVNGLEMDFKAKDNSVLHALMSARIIQIAGVSLILTIFQNVTEQKLLKARLQQAQKMESIGTLAGGIAHDFNNALYSIIGYADLTMDDVPEASPAQSNLKEILNAAYRSKNMVQQILTFSRQKEPEKKLVKVQSVVKEAIQLLRNSIPANIEIRQNIDEGCKPMMADPTQIHQVVMNLATNAYHAMREKGGILTINVTKEKISTDDSASYPDLYPGTYLKLTVGDTGHGMDKLIIPKIFDPFFTTKPMGEGTGMGLSIIHGIVKSHGGDINVYSEPGKGTVFNVYFPLIEAKPVEPGIVSTEPMQKGSECILLVDDEEPIVRMVKQILERLGYQVATRTGSVDALEALRANPDKFDLVITDMSMPNMTGIELSPRLLEIRADIPIILCTGFSEMINKNKAKALGIREFAMKPLVRDEIARIIRKVLDE